MDLLPDRVVKRIFLISCAGHLILLLILCWRTVSRQIPLNLAGRSLSSVQFLPRKENVPAHQPEFPHAETQATKLLPKKMSTPAKAQKEHSPAEQRSKGQSPKKQSSKEQKKLLLEKVKPKNKQPVKDQKKGHSLEKQSPMVQPSPVVPKVIQQAAAVVETHMLDLGAVELGGVPGQQTLLYDSVIATWKSPRGLRNCGACTVHAVLNRDGLVSEVTVIKSSGVPSFDISARRAMLAARYPRELWDSILVVTFS